MRVHQMLPRFDAGDAVSGHALAIQEVLRDRGLESDIFAQGMDEFGQLYGRQEEEYRAYMDSSEDLLIYHYLLFCSNYRMYQETRNRKVLIYHNITPPEFYDDFDPDTADFCRRGKELLLQLTRCDLALGVSEFNRRDLVEAGFEEARTGVLPINPPPDRLTGCAADRSLRRRLGDGKLNLLFVGRLVPNKRLEDLVKLFWFYHKTVNASSRLVMVGSLASAYADHLIELTRRLGLAEKVFFLGKVSDAALKACYDTCHFYVSMSEHEGFCVPLLEAFSFGLPVLAFAAGAVPETMGDSGVLFDEKDFNLLAETLENLRRDPRQRQLIVEAQYRRLEDFGQASFLAKFDRTLGPFLEGGSN